MIEFDKAGVRFNYRVGGVCIEEEHVLLQGSADLDCWVLATLYRIDLRPSFLRGGLRHLPESPVWIEQHDDRG